MAFKLHWLAQVSGSAASVPMLVEGPFRTIQGRLDATGLDKLGSLIDALFGGDHPDTCSDAGLAPPRANPRSTAGHARSRQHVRYGPLHRPARHLHDAAERVVHRQDQEHGAADRQRAD